MKKKIILYTEALFRLIPRAVSHIMTWCKFFFFCSSFGHFRSSGVPYVEISRWSGGDICIGDGFEMNNGMANNQIGYGNTPCILAARGGKIIIGKNVGISQTALVALNADITIGDNTILGSGVKIWTSDFHHLDPDKRRTDSSHDIPVKGCSVSIGEDCFIGAGSIILKGVSIGNRSIIGAGSVVSGSIPENSIAAGNPCRVIRYNKC